MSRIFFFGISTVDLVYSILNDIKVDEKVKSDEFLSTSGGQALNGSITCSILGSEAILTSFIGDSIFGQLIKSELRTYKVQFVDIIKGNQDYPPISAILSSKESSTRTIVTNKISMHVNAKLSNQLIGFLDFSNLVHIDGYYTSFAIEVAKKAKERELEVVIDCGSWKEGYEELLMFGDILICSEKFYPPDMREHSKITKYLKNFASRLIFTRGEKSILVYNQNEYSEVTVGKVNAVDTLGAGDVFQGAFCHYYSNGNNFMESIRLSSKIATNSCMQLGTRIFDELDT